MAHNLAELCRQVLQPFHLVEQIRYFTARVKPSSRDPDQHVRQQTYLRALETLPSVSIHYGHFLAHKVRLPLAEPPPGGPATAEVIKSEEKGSDVNIASYLLFDGFRQRYDCAVLVTNDSDLKTPIVLTRRELKLDVGVVNPHPHPSIDLKRAAKFTTSIKPEHLAQSQFPPSLRDARGRTIRKPTSW